MKSLRRLLLLALCAAAFSSTLPAAEPAPPIDDVAVTLYATQWCRYCAKARDYLAGKGIVYREIDVETPAGRTAFARVGGAGKGVPLLVTSDLQIRGFSKATYDDVFVGYPR